MTPRFILDCWKTRLRPQDLLRQSLVSFTDLAGASNLTGSWIQLPNWTIRDQRWSELLWIWVQASWVRVWWTFSSMLFFKMTHIIRCHLLLSLSLSLKVFGSFVTFTSDVDARWKPTSESLIWTGMNTCQSLHTMAITLIANAIAAFDCSCYSSGFFAQAEGDAVDHFLCIAGICALPNCQAPIP